MVLEGLKVIELADGFSVPFCGMQFADAGADVIKVESPEGDRIRGIGPYTNDVSHLFMALNRGKAARNRSYARSSAARSSSRSSMTWS